MDTSYPHPPLHRLPFEILSSIFLWYKHLHHPYSILSDDSSQLYHDDIDSSRKLPAPDRAPLRDLLLLGSISHYLRAAAWDTPFLWTHISLTLHRSRLASEISGLNAWLARAGTCPMHIRLQCEGDGVGWIKNPPLEAVDVITKHSRHWKEVCLVLPPVCLVQLVNTCGDPGRLGMLRKLTLLVRQQWWGTAEKLPIEAFREAEGLVDVNLFGIPLDVVDLPWTQLTHFRGHPLKTREVLSALRLATNLESYTIACTHGDSYHLSSLPIHHPRLRDLKLTGRMLALQQLTLPALKTLVIECPEGGFISHHFVRLMERSGAMLRCLQLTIDFIPSAQLLECLAATPALEELTLCNLKDKVHSVFVDSVLEKFTLKPGSGRAALVSQLRHLEVLNCSCHFDARMLEEMLWSRWNLREDLGEWRRLEFFGLEAGSVRLPTICDDILGLRRMRAMREEGLILKVRTVNDAGRQPWSNGDFHFGTSRTWLGSSR
ncbi:hypothetical protein FPV67DRAFT_1672492 [Lyophyllum atratum]|nr:hypothetical protein FPV67DRAFT_1672492 [Lyophyllum atratum]